MGQETIRTYRYVRVSIVAAVALLFIALVLQIVRAPEPIRESISAYFYSPVRSVFVGTLVGVAFSLVAIRGRRGGENALLDLAGMLLPLVAIVPTPVEGTTQAPCPTASKCIPDELLSGVEVGVAALLILGAAGLVFAGWTLTREHQAHPVAARRGFAGAVGIWAAVAVWFGPTSGWALRQSFLANGHYVAAILMFACVVGVALINARRSERDIRIARVRVSYRPVYRAVAWAMTVTLVGAVAYWAVAIRPVPGAQSRVILFLEVVVLALFAVFWVAQTAEFWNIGLPAEAREPDPSEAPAPPGLTAE